MPLSRGLWLGLARSTSRQSANAATWLRPTREKLTRFRVRRLCHICHDLAANAKPETGFIYTDITPTFRCSTARRTSTIINREHTISTMRTMTIRAADCAYLLREPCRTIDVRVRPGFSLEASEAHAPSYRELYCPGDVIENLDVEHALKLVAVGVVEVI